MLTLMNKSGLIELVPVDYDGRLKKIVLTKKSLEIHEWINQAMMQLHDKLTDGLTTQQIETFIDVADHMIQNMSKNEQESTD